MLYFMRPVDEIVIGVHILNQVAVFYAARAGGCAGGVNAFGNFIGFGIEFIIIGRFIDADAPNENAGVVELCGDHVTHILIAHFFEFFSANITPAGYLGKDHEAQLIAAIQKFFRLHIVRGAHNGKVQIIFQNVRVLFLYARRGSIADIGVRLMTVQPHQLVLFPV